MKGALKNPEKQGEGGEPGYIKQIVIQDVPSAREVPPIGLLARKMLVPFCVDNSCPR
jgi:hypothetical protein